MSKGSSRRPMAISQEQWEKNWDEAFAPRQAAQERDTGVPDRECEEWPGLSQNDARGHAKDKIID